MCRTGLNHPQKNPYLRYGFLRVVYGVLWVLDGLSTGWGKPGFSETMGCLWEEYGFSRETMGCLWEEYGFFPMTLVSVTTFLQK